MDNREIGKIYTEGLQPSKNKGPIPPRNLREAYNNLLKNEVSRDKKISLPELVQEKYIVRYKRPEDRTFKEIEVSDNQFNQAIKYFRINDDHLRNAAKRISDLGFGSKIAEQLISIVLKHEHPENFFSALDNQMSLNEFLLNKDFFNYAKTKYNLDHNLLFELVEYAPLTTPSTGRGEVFMTLFIRDAKKGTQGDIVINDLKFEVKGSGARLMGQRGVGNKIAAGKAFSTELQRLAKKANIKVDNSTLNFDINFGSAGSVNDIAPALLLTNKVNRVDIINLYAKGFHELFPRANYNEIKSWVSKSLNANGTINNNFHENYFIFGLQYYTLQEDFDYLVMMGTAPQPLIRFGKMNWLTRDDILSNNDITSRVAVASWPRFGASAGNMGGFFAIKPVL